MPCALFPTFMLQMLIVGYTPGPANIYSLAMSLRHGRRTSLVMWLGLLTGFCLAVSIMAVLTYLIGLSIGTYVSYLRYAGDAYLVYLAYKIYNRSVKADGNNADCTFLNGMLVQLTNAKMLLFDLSAFSTFVLPYSNPGSFLRRFFTDYGRLIDVVSSIALIGCAVWIVVSAGETV